MLIYFLNYSKYYLLSEKAGSVDFWCFAGGVQSDLDRFAGAKLAYRQQRPTSAG